MKVSAFDRQRIADGFTHQNSVFVRDDIFIESE